jgi:NADPH:quinone reductase-like Zn-dependent oxidoreductase
MRAAVYRKFGPPDVVGIEEVAQPAPGPRDVLVRMRATTVTSGDARLRARDLPKGFEFVGPLAIGVFGPRRKVLGTEFAGEVVSVGAEVSRFKVGDRVFGLDVFDCHADFKRVREDKAIALIPEGVTFEAAVSVPFGGLTALYFLRRAGLQPGQTLAAVGASGAVGAMTVQLAAAQGLVVTGVSSGANLELVRELGAQRVIDYTKADFTREGVVYDAIFDTVGAVPFEDCVAALAPDGAFLNAVAPPLDMIRTRRQGRRIIAGTASERPDDLRQLAGMLESGALQPVIDGVHAFEDIVAAHARVDTKRKRGAVVVRF